jgi:hypothetical protein
MQCSKPLTRLQGLWCALGFGLVYSLIFIGRIDPTNPQFSHMDWRWYRLMAEVGTVFPASLPQPFIYRIAGPIAAGALPWSIDTNFYLLSLVNGLLLVTLFYRYLCHHNISPHIAALAISSLIMNKFLFIFPIWDYFQLNDIISLNCMIILLFAMEKQYWRIYAITLCIGALTRETTFLTIPVTYWYLYNQRLLRSQGLSATLSMIPGIALFILLRVLIDAPGAGLGAALVDYGAKIYSPEAWLRLGINAFLPLTLIPAIGYRTARQFFRQRPDLLILIAGTLASTLFGIDNERLMAPAIFVFYWLLAVIIERELVAQPALLISLFTASFVASFHHFMGAYPLPLPATVGLTAGGTILATVAAYNHRRPPPALDRAAIR